MERSPVWFAVAMKAPQRKRALTPVTLVGYGPECTDTASAGAQCCGFVHSCFLGKELVAFIREGAAFQPAHMWGCATSGPPLQPQQMGVAEKTRTHRGASLTTSCNKHYPVVPARQKGLALAPGSGERDICRRGRAGDKTNRVRPGGEVSDVNLPRWVSLTSQASSMQPKPKGRATGRSGLFGDLLLKLQPNYLLPLVGKSAAMKGVWCWWCRQGARCVGLPTSERTPRCLCCCYLTGRLKLAQTRVLLVCFENR